MSSSVVHILSALLPDEIKGWAHSTYHMKAADMAHEPPSRSVTRKESSPDHFLLIVIDALRPDFIPDLPLDFTHAIAPAPWTFPSITSMHTGLRPSEHKAVAHTHSDDEGYAMPAQTDARPHYPLDIEAAGYETYAGLGFTLPFLTVRNWYQTHQYYSDADASEVIADYRKWRQNRERTAAYLHFGDLHAPVAPSQEYINRHNVDMTLPNLGHINKYKTDFKPDDEAHQHYRDEKIKLHEAALEYVSDQIRPLVDSIQDDTVVIITGDHGEALWEHQEIDRLITDSRPNYCFGHGGTPFDTIARVPLAIGCPNRNLTPKGGWATLRDIPATILDTITEDYKYQGYSWRKEIPENRSVVCEGTRYGVERKAVYEDDYKLIHSRSDDVTLTAKISEDGETFVDIPDSVESRLISKLPNHWDDMDNKDTVSNKTQEHLEALGYK